MLPETQVVKIRNALESMYGGVCTVSEYEEYAKDNGSAGYRETAVLEGQPCRLSFSSSPATEAADNGANRVTQTIKVFLPPDIAVKAGSKLTITQNGTAADYKASGEPAVYPTHQEIALELVKRWS